MTSLLAKELQKAGILAEVSHLELDRAGKSYTSDTLRELTRENPADTLYLIMGGDMFLTLDRWHESEVIFSLAHIAAAAREGDEWERLEAKKREYESIFHARITLLKGAVLELSSTDVRSAMARGEARLLMPESVADYAAEKRLYGGKTKIPFESIKTQLTAEISGFRMNHINGVTQESVRLAAFHGIDPDKARLAALLHDCTKEWDEKKQLQLCEECGIMVERELLDSPQLLHALSGSLRAKKEFGVEDEIASAIRWHATGREEMSPLEMLIYVADLVEPTRRFADDVTDIRTAAEESLEVASMMEAERVLSLEQARGRRLHPQTLKTYEYYKKIRKQEK